MTRCMLCISPGGATLARAYNETCNALISLPCVGRVSAASPGKKDGYYVPVNPDEGLSLSRRFSGCRLSISKNRRSLSRPDPSIPASRWFSPRRGADSYKTCTIFPEQHHRQSQHASHYGESAAHEHDMSRKLFIKIHIFLPYSWPETSSGKFKICDWLK